VAARRGAFGRARKGSLAGERPEYLSLNVVRATVAAVPAP
jgi:acetyl-CoA C-acetyltransferase